MLPHSMHSCDVRRKCRQGLAGARMASISRRTRHMIVIDEEINECAIISIVIDE